MPPKKKVERKEEQVFVEENGSYVHQREMARYTGGVRRLTDSNFCCRHGHGTYSSPLIHYEGNWSEDEMHGNGTLRFLVSGDSYTGQFVHGVMEGCGTYIWASGAMYDGGWRGNRMHGLGTYTDVGGKVWSGKFYNGSGPGLTPCVTTGGGVSAADKRDVLKDEKEG
ncbi:hypothetical protein, conserved [Trypanosoma brucei gambiense DAL972]|uniref:MORN repeat n=2 Tax=Trypanosoma brucei TaxID=5691 RepID=C9ZVG4_TRYB9|nr:hypothetical protein, conserved [Trypanosoma brucei gambiense DAL972]RHW71010.1 MORN repeat [Trypanosoma brucei equiperdum]CBH13402.1 hypothetical protein, conserved [Trypanosoma brucei gambiense DAL972]|eukprot:XP_011775679.1 hypothetical protein, conserved [Trypanosoma brucei gambiense DAL972]